MIVAQSDLISVFNRQQAGGSLAIPSSAMARSLAQLTTPNNTVLLKHHQPHNKHDLSSLFNSGDEATSIIDEWTDYDPSLFPCHQQKAWGRPNFVLTGTIDTIDSYTVRADRFNPQTLRPWSLNRI